jgi:hypothetical protein
MSKAAFLSIGVLFIAASASAKDCAVDAKRMVSPLDTSAGRVATAELPVFDKDTVTQRATLAGGQRLLYSADVFADDQGEGQCAVIEESSLKFLDVHLKDRARNARFLEAIGLMRASPTRQLPAAKADVVFEAAIELLEETPTVAGSPQKASLLSGLRAALKTTPALDAGSFMLVCHDSLPGQCLLWSHADETDGRGPTLSLGMQRYLK